MTNTEMNKESQRKGVEEQQNRNGLKLFPFPLLWPAKEN